MADMGGFGMGAPPPMGGMSRYDFNRDELPPGAYRMHGGDLKQMGMAPPKFKAPLER